jgi:hypothetical protein
MRFLKTVFALAGAFLVSGAAMAQSAPTWCANNEYPVFSCQTGKKVASVCASEHLSKDHGYIQYRFGEPGHEMELAYPDLTAKPDTVFRMSRADIRRDTGSVAKAYHLGFSNNGAHYGIVLDESERTSSASILVRTASGKVSYLACNAGTVRSGLASLWNSEALPALRD